MKLQIEVGNTRFHGQVTIVQILLEAGPVDDPFREYFAGVEGIDINHETYYRLSLQDGNTLTFIHPDLRDRASSLG